MERDQAVRLTQNLLRKMVENKGSDLFITAEFPPAIKIDGSIKPFADRPLTSAQSSLIVRSIMNDKQAKEFDATKEANFAIAPQGIGRFRVSAFIQQGNVGAVIRTIETKIPTFEDLELPPQLKDVAMTKRGLCLVVGGTGPISISRSTRRSVFRDSGKSRIKPVNSASYWLRSSARLRSTTGTSAGRTRTTTWA
jgi:twitching motility protein PilU